MNVAKSEIDILWSRIRNMAGSRPFRSRPFREYVGRRRCVLCNAEGPNDPHHLFGSYGSLKTSDVFVVPVCRKCPDTKAERPENRAALLEAWIALAKDTIENGLIA